MSLSLQSSLLFIVITTVIAIALSFLSDDTICVSLASQLETLDPSSVHGLLIQTLHQRFCGQAASQQDSKQDDWNLFYHLGGNGPWVEKVDARFGTYEKDGKPPPGCVIDQVHMVRKMQKQCAQKQWTTFQSTRMPLKVTTLLRTRPADSHLPARPSR